MAGFVADSREVSATKVDDTFTISGRMPPNPGEFIRSRGVGRLIDKREFDPRVSRLKDRMARLE